eukprot:SAG11_NODE_10501_length_826_cov_1.313618_1_plen_78_part_00
MFHKLYRECTAYLHMHTGCNTIPGTGGFPDGRIFHVPTVGFTTFKYSYNNGIAHAMGWRGITVPTIYGKLVPSTTLP